MPESACRRRRWYVTVEWHLWHREGRLGQHLALTLHLLQDTHSANCHCQQTVTISKPSAKHQPSVTVSQPSLSANCQPNISQPSLSANRHCQPTVSQASANHLPKVQPNISQLATNFQLISSPPKANVFQLVDNSQPNNSQPEANNIPTCSQPPDNRRRWLAGLSHLFVTCFCNWCSC